MRRGLCCHIRLVVFISLLIIVHGHWNIVILVQDFFFGGGGGMQVTEAITVCKAHFSRKF